jgi:hypothetical protein
MMVLCGKDNFAAQKVVGSIPLCRDLKEVQDELRLTSYIITAESCDLTFPHHVHCFNAF